MQNQKISVLMIAILLRELYQTMLRRIWSKTGQKEPAHIFNNSASCIDLFPHHSEI